MSNFDLKSFMINEGLTRVSRDRNRLLKENWEQDDDEDRPEMYQDKDGTYKYSHVPKGLARDLAQGVFDMPGNFIGNESAKAAWAAIKVYDEKHGGLLEFSGYDLEEEMYDNLQNKLNHPGVKGSPSTEGWYFELEKGTERPTGTYAWATVEELGFAWDFDIDKYGWNYQKNDKTDWDEIGDFVNVAQKSADIVFSCGGETWSAVYLLKKISNLNEGKRVYTASAKHVGVGKTRTNDKGTHLVGNNGKGKEKDKLEKKETEKTIRWTLNGITKDIPATEVSKYNKKSPAEKLIWRKKYGFVK